MLSNKNKKELRALKNKVITYQIGKNLLNKDVFDSLDKGLTAHELIKISFQKSISSNIDEMLKDICKNLNTELAEQIGFTALIYRPNPKKKDRIKLS